MLHMKKQRRCMLQSHVYNVKEMDALYAAYEEAKTLHAADQPFIQQRGWLRYLPHVEKQTHSTLTSLLHTPSTAFRSHVNPTAPEALSQL